MSLLRALSACIEQRGQSKGMVNNMKFNSNDARTPAERIGDDLLRRVIEQNCSGENRRGLRRNGLGITGQSENSVPWPPAGGARGGNSSNCGCRSGNGGCRERTDNGGCRERTDSCGCRERTDNDGSKERTDNCGCRERTDNGGCRERTDNGGCGCRHGGDAGKNTGWGLYGYPLAMVYSPIQCFGELYEPDDGLSHGTICSQLDLPFEGKGGCRK